MRELPWMLSVAACMVLGTAWLFAIAEEKRDLLICRSSVASAFGSAVGSGASACAVGSSAIVF